MEGLNNEVIIEALTNNEELRGQFMESFQTTEFGKTALSNHAESHWNNKINQTIGEIHGKYEQDVLSVTGQAKTEGVKSFDYMKSELARLKAIADTANPELLTEKEQVIADLQKKLESNEGAGHYKNLYDQLQGESQNRVGELTSQIEALNSKIKSGTIDRELNKVMSSLEFNKDLPKSLVDNFIQSELSQITKDAQILEDGSIVFFKDGVAITDSKTMGKITTDKLLSERLASVLATKTAQGGGGQGPDASGAGKTTPVSASVSGATTQTQLHKALTSELVGKGLKKGTDAWKTAFNTVWDERSINLPLGE